MNEIRMLKILRHPGIISLLSIYESAEYVHMVFEYMRNTQLFATIKEKPNYSEADAVKIMKSLLQAIAHIHGNNIIYRDIKPENIILM